jgi:hypothetical protein
MHNMRTIILLYAYILPKRLALSQILKTKEQRTRDGGKVDGKQKKKGHEQSTVEYCRTTKMGQWDS